MHPHTLPQMNPDKLSRRRLLQWTGGIAGAGLLAGCTAIPDGRLLQMPAGSTLRPFTHTRIPPLPKRAAMPFAAPDANLDVKIGQMLMLGFRGQAAQANSAITQVLQEYHLGAVVLFEHNIARNEQASVELKRLTSALQSAAALPLLIAIDQEGGWVNRLRSQYGFPSTVSAGYLGRVNDLAITREYAGLTAGTLAAHGINLNLAPVVDLDLNASNPVIGAYERSFSADPAIVTAHAEAFITTHRAEKVLCTLKHFPGHGSSRADTHLGFVNVTDTWKETELDPYRHLIDGGLADAIMTAHIFNGTLDGEYPATLSRPIITGILRDQLGYDGVVISDDMQMRAISRYYPFEEAVQAAVLAGVDMIAIANTLTYRHDAAARAHGAIRALVDGGRIAPERIDASFRRIAALKAQVAA